MPIQPQTILNNSLWKIRKNRGLAQKQIAWLLGHKSSSLISSYERGERVPGLEAAFRLAVIYQCPVEKLFPEHWEAISSELTEKASKLPGTHFTPLSNLELVEGISICSYEQLLQGPDVSEENSRLVRKHVTKLAKQLAYL